jgi:hypothetical protein
MTSRGEKIGAALAKAVKAATQWGLLRACWYLPEGLRASFPQQVRRNARRFLAP